MEATVELFARSVHREETGNKETKSRGDALVGRH